MEHERQITAERLAAFSEQLRREERAAGTEENYLRHVRAFAGGNSRLDLDQRIIIAALENCFNKDFVLRLVERIYVRLNRFADGAAGAVPEHNLALLAFGARHGGKAENKNQYQCQREELFHIDESLCDICTCIERCYYSIRP